MLRGAADAETIDLMVRVRAIAPLALQVQQDLLLAEEGVSDSLRNKVADKLLDRAMGKPVQRTANLNVNYGLTDDDISEIKRRAKELKASAKVEDE
jgi:hypothetical protein